MSNHEKWSFNLPDFQGRYLGGNGQGYVSESLPNITGKYGARGMRDPVTTSGAFYDAGTYAGGDSGESSSSRLIGFDASRSSSAYQDGAKVKPDTLLCNLVIKY